MTPFAGSPPRVMPPVLRTQTDWRSYDRRIAPEMNAFDVWATRLNAVSVQSPTQAA
jgi:hypothetical protein